MVDILFGGVLLMALIGFLLKKHVYDYVRTARVQPIVDTDENTCSMMSQESV
jgi:hypothetical protein